MALRGMSGPEVKNALLPPIGDLPQIIRFGLKSVIRKKPCQLFDDFTACRSQKGVYPVIIVDVFSTGTDEHPMTAVVPWNEAVVEYSNLCPVTVHVHAPSVIYRVSHKRML